MGCIYMRTSPSGKSYIGYTNYPESKRWKEHCCQAFNKKDPNYNTHLNKAIRKYGSENFTCIILEDEIFDYDVLKEREIYWINYYNTFKNGYNSTRGGDGCKIVDTEDIIKLWNEGHCVRDICLLLNIGPATALNHLKFTPQEAEKRGPVYKTKNSMKFFGDFKTGKGIEISCYEKTTGEFVKTFKSLYEAAKFCNAKDSSAIRRSIEGRIRTAFGYIWREGNDTNHLSDEILEDINRPRKLKKRPVICTETNIVYSDTKYAEKLTGICYRSIIFTCKGSQKTAGGYHWRYATEEEKNTLMYLEPKKIYKQANNIRAVRCVETGEVFSSLKLAGESIGLSNGAIYNACKKSSTAGGFHWEYA